MAILSTGRKHIVAALNGFHGKTLGSLATTSKAVFRSPFLGSLLNVTHVPLNDVAALRQAFKSARMTGNEIAGLILEPVQGEGGIHVCTDDFLKQARKVCDEYGANLIFDEVQTGMGRTGKWWGCQHAGVVPDLMAIGKAFGGGVMPVGACIGTKKVWEKYVAEPFLMTTTFGGNPLALSAAIAALYVVESEGLVEKAGKKGDYMMAALRGVQKQFPLLLTEVRGRGLMIGLEFATNDIGVLYGRGMFARKVLVSGTLSNSLVVRIEPPLTIEYDQIDQVVEATRLTLEQIHKSMRAKL
jgi:putrescine aminotransferase